MAGSEGQGSVCIVAGAGRLPSDVAIGARSQGRDVVIAHLEGSSPDVPEGLDHFPFRLERLGALLQSLKQSGVTDVVMAGALHRPKLQLHKLDARTLLLVPRILSAMRSGDDSAIRSAISVFEAAGLKVRGAHEFVPEFVVSAGPLNKVIADAQLEKDAKRGQAILDALGPQDVAQACIVARGQCLGIETIYGTDALLADVARHRDDRQPSHGGVMVKRPKVGQEMRVDMPVIGPQTVVAAAGARLTGIHLAAEQVMVLEAAEVVETANRLEIAIWAS